MKHQVDEKAPNRGLNKPLNKSVKTNFTLIGDVQCHTKLLKKVKVQQKASEKEIKSVAPTFHENVQLKNHGGDNSGTTPSGNEKALMKDNDRHYTSLEEIVRTLKFKLIRSVLIKHIEAS